MILFALAIVYKNTGAGCHWDVFGDNKNGPAHGLNQFNAYNNENPGQNLVQDLDCQCNYFLKGDGNWEPWIKTALYGNDDGANEPSYQGYAASVKSCTPK